MHGYRLHCWIHIYGFTSCFWFLRFGWLWIRNSTSLDGTAFPPRPRVWEEIIPTELLPTHLGSAGWGQDMPAHEPWVLWLLIWVMGKFMWVIGGEFTGKMWANSQAWLKAWKPNLKKEQVQGGSGRLSSSVLAPLLGWWVQLSSFLAWSHLRLNSWKRENLNVFS